MSHCHAAGPENEPAESTACSSSVLAGAPELFRDKFGLQLHPVSLLAFSSVSDRKTKQNKITDELPKQAKPSYSPLPALPPLWNPLSESHR